MAHTYEEVRTAAFDVLAGRATLIHGVPTSYQLLASSVAVLLRERDEPASRTDSYMPQMQQLDTGDAYHFQEVFWDLFRQGIITLGLNPSNLEFPWFRLTTVGQNVLAGENNYFVHDVSAYTARLKVEIPNLDPKTLIYLQEALQDFRSGCLLSSAVMVGVAAEHTFELLLATTTKNPKWQSQFAPAAKERSILPRVNAFVKLLEPRKTLLPPETRENLDTQFQGILAFIRNFRNDSGHPTGKILTRDQAHLGLQLFPFAATKMYQLMDFFSQP